MAELRYLTPAYCDIDGCEQTAKVEVVSKTGRVLGRCCFVHGEGALRMAERRERQAALMTGRLRWELEEAPNA